MDQEMKPIRAGKATRVLFFYPGEEGTYLTNLDVQLYANGIVHLKSSLEEITTHISNLEIVWHDEKAKDATPPCLVRTLRPVPTPDAHI